MRAITTALLALAAGALGACAIDPGPTSIRVDGDWSEWPDGHRAVADDDYVYIRFTSPGGDRTLQASDVPTRILIDADGDDATGLRAHGLGAELEITLSPEGRGYGSRVRTFDAAGVAGEAGHADIGFHFAPTYAAYEYEARIARGAWAMGALAEGPGVMQAGVVIGDDARLATAVVRAPERRPHADARLPQAPDGCVRVVSWNVLRGMPMREPDAFGRVLAALRPDVVLVQEWDDVDSSKMAAWFNEHAPLDAGAWSAAALPDSGVGVVTRHELAAGPGGPVSIEGGWPARCVGAVVRTPAGELLCASLHLKCCGSNGSDEDLRRMAETHAIAGALPAMFPGSAPDTVVVAGDLNLVGSRPPVDILAETLDVDGSSLAIADARVLGDGSVYTWWDADSSFTPGRLDWVLVGDRNASIAGAFVLDARRLGDDALAAAGLQRGDTGVSDHLPVVVDIRIPR